MKTIEQIREETPFSVTSTDNPIFIMVKPITVNVFKRIQIGDEFHTIATDKPALVLESIKLRLLQCYDDARPNWYRWGDGNEQILIPDEYTRYYSGNIGINTNS